MELLFYEASRPFIPLLKWFVPQEYTLPHQKLLKVYTLQLVDLSAAQDVEAGDGTTTVVVLAGSLLGAAEKMLNKGMHPTIIAEAFLKASAKAVEYLTEISVPIDLDDNPALLRAATTSLNSKVIHLITLMTFVRVDDVRRLSRNIPPPLHQLLSKRSAASSRKPHRTSICEIFVLLKRSAVLLKIPSLSKALSLTKTLLSPLGVQHGWKRPRSASFSSN